MTSLALVIVLLSTPLPSTEPDPLFDAPVACAIARAPPFPDPASSTDPLAPAPDPELRPLALAAEWKVSNEDLSQQAIPLSVGFDHLTALPTTSRRRLESPGRGWPFALAVTADAATTYWALSRGGTERNPLLLVGRADMGMVKILQFPLLAKAVDMVAARNPRLGRRLLWTTLVFHALLAFNNVRLGRAAVDRGPDGRPKPRD
jgi:hypothetical protein